MVMSAGPSVSATSTPVMIPIAHGTPSVWKYGIRAFRYCQHDVGHAIGALRFAAALLGWRLELLPEWSDAQIAALHQRVERAEREREAFATHILAIEQANAKHMADQRTLAEALSRRLAPTVENGAGPDAAA